MASLGERDGETAWSGGLGDSGCQCARGGERRVGGMCSAGASPNMLKMCLAGPHRIRLHQGIVHPGIVLARKHIRHREGPMKRQSTVHVQDATKESESKWGHQSYQGGLLRCEEGESKSEDGHAQIGSSSFGDLA